jgi:PhnB protein
MLQLNPYLTFNGQCREAMTFYRDSLGGELTLLTVGESPMSDQCAPESKDQIMHSSLVNGSFMLMATDMSMTEGIIGNNVSLSLTCSTEEELKTAFSNIAAGGTVNQPLSEFFAGTIGNVTDKFGIIWTFYMEKKLSAVTK